MTKITLDQAAEIRRLAQVRPCLTYGEIGRRFGVSRSTATAIAHGRSRLGRAQLPPLPRRLPAETEEAVTAALRDLLDDSDFNAKADRALPRRMG